eukprot:TRINITY_DN11194_c0_g1_i1.p1 TRINITY_DN11194_c0_g1~~TRINITY_DN11194_c0_g1_i1.p1  ORF type:complete len:631 (+),score=96.27 TRINITY_DN11194_c0_g1_i1:51-1943(+)
MPVSVEDLAATVKRQGEMLKAQQRLLATMMLEKYTATAEVNDILEMFAETVTPSVELMKGIDDATIDADVPLFRRVHELAVDKRSDSLRKKTSQMLGSLMLKSDLNPDSIAFLSNDLPSVFSSSFYPRLVNEDDYLKQMLAASSLLSANESMQLVPLLDLPMLSDSAIHFLERELRNNPTVFDELRNQKFVSPKRKYKFDQNTNLGGTKSESGIRPTAVDEETLTTVGSEPDMCLLAPDPISVTASQLSDEVGRSEVAARFEEQPEVTCLLDISEYLDDNLAFVADNNLLPPSVRHLSFINGGCCASIGNSFLSKCRNLTTIDLSCLQRVTSIGARFLHGYRSLTSISIPEEVRTIGPEFLAGCDSLTSVDFTAAQCIKAIGESFLRGCKSLETIDLVTFISLDRIPDGFLFGCESLTTISNITSLRNVESIGDNFLNLCMSLKDVDLTAFTKVKSIGGCFLAGCRTLEKVDLSAFKKVTCTNERFLSRCESLKTILNMDGLGNVDSVGYNFLFGCSSLQSIDLSPLTNVSAISGFFLAECKSLESIDFSAFEKVTSIDDSFLSGCESLKTISNMKGLKNVEKVKKSLLSTGFLNGCTSITSVDIPIEGNAYLTDTMKEVLEKLKKQNTN